MTCATKYVLPPIAAANNYVATKRHSSIPPLPALLTVPLEVDELEAEAEAVLEEENETLGLDTHSKTLTWTPKATQALPQNDGSHITNQ